MTWLDKLEKKYGNYGLEGLMRYISLLMLSVYVLNASNLLPYNKLYLNLDAILHGEVWRLFTFLLIPQSHNILFLIFELSILVMCADGLEAEWGTFRLTVYYFTGALANILMACIVPEIQLGSYFIYLSLFLGFATLYPDYEILLFLIIPVKMKYLALLSGAWILYVIAISPIYLKLAMLLSVGNYILFFWKEALNTIRRNHRQRGRRRVYEAKLKDLEKPKNECIICHRTEITNPELEFRYCTCKECGPDGRAFCMEHLKEHLAKIGSE